MNDASSAPRQHVFRMDSRPADSTSTPSAPQDWPRLWDALLQARADGGDDALPHGDWSDASRTLSGLYRPLLAPRGRWCIGQLGQSLDGFIATASGDSYFVTGPQSLLHLHRLRALADAVLVGGGTVAADDPQLTTRRVPGPQPVRVLLDPAARGRGDARALHDGQAPTLWLCDARHASRAASKLAAASPAEVVAVDGLLGDDDRFEPARVVEALAARGLQRLFVEGGGVTVSRFIESGRLDRLHLVIAPVLIGAGRRGLSLPPTAVMRDCPRPPARRYELGEDTLWDLDLRAPPADGVASRST